MSEIYTVQRALRRAQEKHSRCVDEVTRLERAVGPTAFKLVDAKREKLKAKDEITRLEAVLEGFKNKILPVSS